MSLETEGDVFGVNPPGAVQSEHGEGEPPSAPAATTAPAEPAALAADAGATAPAPTTDGLVTAPAEVGTGSAPEQEPTLYAGRYASVEELEAGYLNVQAFATREAQQRAVLEDQMSRLAQGPPQAGPMPGGYQPQQPQPQPTYPYAGAGAANVVPAVELLPVPDFESDPQGYQRAIVENANRTAAAAAAAQVATSQAQWQAEQTARAEHVRQQAYIDRATGSIDRFRAAHSIAPGSATDVTVGQVASAYYLPVEDQSALDFAFEMTQNPSLAKAAQSITQASGLQWGQTAEGRAWVRQMAGIAPPGSPPAAVPNGQQAHLEHGGSGAPIPGAPGPAARPNDGWEGAKALAEQRLREATAI